MKRSRKPAIGFLAACLENFSRRGRGYRFEMYTIAQMLDL
jgi:hypothetical protein